MEREFLLKKSLAWTALCRLAKEATGLDGAYLNAMIGVAIKHADLSMITQAPMSTGNRLGLWEDAVSKS